MDYDEYGEVINGSDTYKRIATNLRTGGKTLIGWTDQQGTHFDILFCFGAMAYGNNIQGGIAPKRDLFVSIMRWGAFAFAVERADTHWGYFEEKLGSRGGFGELAGTKLAELINGVKRELI